MTKLENGGSEGRQQDALGELTKPEKTSSRFLRSPEKALLKSSALTAFSFLIHVLFLLLIDPLNVLDLSKETAYIYASIPLCFGVGFLILSVYYFIMIEERSAFHVLLLLVALSFGSMSLQGLLGLGLHYVRLSLESG